MPETVDSLGPGPSQNYINWLKELEDIQFLQRGKDLPIKTLIEPTEQQQLEIEKLLKFSKNLATRSCVFDSKKFIPTLSSKIEDMEQIQKCLKEIQTLPENTKNIETFKKFLTELLEIKKLEEKAKKERNRYNKG